MSETNEAKKEPGQVAYEARHSVHTWGIEHPTAREAWARAERAVLDAYAPRLATLEAETRELHRTVSELRIDAQAQRAGRVEAEHRLGLLVNEAGRRVLAIRSRKLVRRLRKRVAELEAFEGSMAEAAMRGAQEVIALQARVEALMHGSETLEREREGARDGWQRAQQAEAVRPDAPDLRPGDEVTVVRPGFTRRGRGRVLDAPALFDGVWQVRCAEIDCEEPGRVSTMPVDWIDMASRVRPPQRQPAPDLRKGDTVAHLSGCNVRIEDAPYLGPGDVWWVRCSDAARPVSSLALYLRVRTWQPGEVVPQAPLTVMRDSSTGARAFTASGGINPNLPLAEPWTQTGV